MRSYLLFLPIVFLFFIACKSKDSFPEYKKEEPEKINLGYGDIDPKESTTNPNIVNASEDPLSLADYLRRVPGVRVSGGDRDGLVIISGFDNSLSLSNQPLFVLDGNRIGRSLFEASSVVNSRDIKRVTVLKQPTDTSFYGLDGANGVIIIETKKQ